MALQGRSAGARLPAWVCAQPLSGTLGPAASVTVHFSSLLSERSQEPLTVRSSYVVLAVSSPRYRRWPTWRQCMGLSVCLCPLTLYRQLTECAGSRAALTAHVLALMRLISRLWGLPYRRARLCCALTQS